MLLQYHINPILSNTILQFLKKYLILFLSLSTSGFLATCRQKGILLPERLWFPFCAVFAPYIRADIFHRLLSEPEPCLASCLAPEPIYGCIAGNQYLDTLPLLWCFHYSTSEDNTSLLIDMRLVLLPWFTISLITSSQFHPSSYINGKRTGLRVA